MKYALNNRCFVRLVILLLYATQFLGLMPFAGWLSFTSRPPFILQMFILALCALYIPKSEYTKWLKILWLVFILNKISSVVHGNMDSYEAIFSGNFVFEFAFFYAFAYIGATVKQTEKAVLVLGTIGLIIYFVQYISLPHPILLSLSSGWRTKENVTDFDILRFTINGESLICLCALMIWNRFLCGQHKMKYILFIISVSVMIVLHGYRSMMFGFFASLLYLYLKVTGVRLDVKKFIFIVVGIITYNVVMNMDFFSDVIGRIVEKNENQQSDTYLELDRYIEWVYFYDNIKKPWEWLFGAGFLNKNLDRNSLLWINWVDLGFIGMTFMGGILLVICWLRILLLNFRKISPQFYYLQAFSLYVIASSLTLNIAFSDRCVVIQCLAMYLFYHVKYEKLKYKNVTIFKYNNDKNRFLSCK